MNRTQVPPTVALVIAATAAAAQDSPPAPPASTWDLSWHSTDSGGGFSSGPASGGAGQLTLVGAIGQPDAGSERAHMSGGAWSLSGGYLPASPLRPHCPADCDESGSLEFFDFLCFQNLFSAGDPRADCDESGALDFFDFLCFQNQFALGCP